MNFSENPSKTFKNPFSGCKYKPYVIGWSILLNFVTFRGHQTPERNLHTRFRKVLPKSGGAAPLI